MAAMVRGLSDSGLAAFYDDLHRSRGAIEAGQSHGDGVEIRRAAVAGKIANQWRDAI